MAILEEAARETVDPEAREIIRAGITRLKMMMEVEKIDLLLEEINKEKRHAGKWYSIPNQQRSRGTAAKYPLVQS